MAIQDLRRQGVKEDQVFKIIQDRKEQRAKEWGITVEDKWDAYSFSIDTLLQIGKPKSLLVYGTGGVGKTYTLFEQQFPANDIRMYDEELDLDPSEYDAIKISGSIGLRDFWRIVVANKDKIIVFDDCDNMWSNEAMANILKGMLDSSGDGTVRYGNATKDEDGNQLPRQIKFTGKAIFISNLTRKEFVENGMSPIVDSRASAIDLTMNMEQTLQKLNNIKYKMKFENARGEKLNIPNSVMDKVTGFLEKHKDDLRIEQVNGRTLSNLAITAYQIYNNDSISDKDRFFEKQAAIKLDLV